jgi:hypothetical protein
MNTKLDIFIFTKEMMEFALRTNGWHTMWNEDNWIKKESTNPDWGGMPLTTAFNKLLKEHNFININSI